MKKTAALVGTLQHLLSRPPALPEQHPFTHFGSSLIATGVMREQYMHASLENFQDVMTI